MSDPTPHDPVHEPSHYTQGGVECIDAIEAAVTGLAPFEAFLVGNCLKYIWRFDKKNGNEDLEKAKWYLDTLLVYREGEGK